MSGQDIALVLEERTVQGKQVRQLRRDGMIPAVIHDHGKPSKIVMAPYTSVLKVYQQAGKHHPLSLTLGKETYMALIKDVDFEPKKHQLRHLVFNAIKQDEKAQTEVPLRLTGEIPAEKASLLVLTQLDHVEVEALPKDLPDLLEVDASKLAEVGDHLTVADITVPVGVTILTGPEMQIAIVEMPRDQVAEADAAVAELAGETEETETETKAEGKETKETTDSSEEE